MGSFLKGAAVAAAGYAVGRYTASHSDKNDSKAVEEYIANTPLREYIQNYMKAHDISDADYWFKEEIKSIIE